MLEPFDSIGRVEDREVPGIGSLSDRLLPILQQVTGAIANLVRILIFLALLSVSVLPLFCLALLIGPDGEN